jgi:hypothetical protein
MAINTSAAINTEALMRKILIIRGHRVLLDSELAIGPGLERWSKALGSARSLFVG